MTIPNAYPAFTPNILELQAPNYFDGESKPPGAVSRAMAKQAQALSEDTVGSRLERLREVMQYGTQTGFSAFLGVTLSRYNNVARDDAPLSRQLEEILVRKCPGVTGAWLRYGDPSGLPVELARKLGAI